MQEVQTVETRRSTETTRLQSFLGCGRPKGATTKEENYVVPAEKFRPENNHGSFTVTRMCFTQSGIINVPMFLH